MINQIIEIIKTSKVKRTKVITKIITNVRMISTVAFDAIDIAKLNAKIAGNIMKAKTYRNLFSKTSSLNHDRIRLFFINIFPP